MRIEHEQKARRLKRLDEKGAESSKIDETRKDVRNLSTKIRIAIQVVDRISVKINTLRDDELWPQLNEFIKGYVNPQKILLLSCCFICLTFISGLTPLFLSVQKSTCMRYIGFTFHAFEFL